MSSVQWAADATHLAIGTSDAKVQIWDAGRAKQVRGSPGGWLGARWCAPAGTHNAHVHLPMGQNRACLP